MLRPPCCFLCAGAHFRLLRPFLPGQWGHAPPEEPAAIAGPGGGAWRRVEVSALCARPHAALPDVVSLLESRRESGHLRGCCEPLSPVSFPRQWVWRSHRLRPTERAWVSELGVGGASRAWFLGSLSSCPTCPAPLLAGQRWALAVTGPLSPGPRVRRAPRVGEAHWVIHTAASHVQAGPRHGPRFRGCCEDGPETDARSRGGPGVWTGKSAGAVPAGTPSSRDGSPFGSQVLAVELGSAE